MLALLVSALLGAQNFGPPISLDDSLVLEISNAPTEASRGGKCTFDVTITNNGAETAYFDSAQLVACPPNVCVILDLYAGRDIALNPQQSLQAKVSERIPGGAPTGEYHMIVQTQDDFVINASDDFYMDVN